MKPLSLTARISLYFAAAACSVLLATGYFLAHVVDSHFAEGDKHELVGKLELVENLLRHADTAAARSTLSQQLDDALVGHHGLSVTVIDPERRRVFATPTAAFPEARLAQCQARPEACHARTLQHWRQDGIDYRGLIVALRSADGPAYTVALSLDITRHENFMDSFLLGLAIAIALAALATAALGWVVTRWGLAPLRQVTEAVAGISAERLTTRLPDAGLPRELKPLVAAFNAMLARLDDSFSRLSEFSSDIAHELRTPISNLMTQTQVALSSARDATAYREVLYSSLEEYERMAQMVGDMLYLAKTDNGLLKPSEEAVDLTAETQNLFDYFEAWAEDASVSLKRTGSATVAGDRLMLRRALSNLIANAIRHTPPGHAVTVTLDETDAETTASIENVGAPIPAAHLPRLFDRFYRVDPSRQRAGDGVGLGLAIVKAIVTAHGGSIAVSSSSEATRFVMRLPNRGDRTRA